MASSVCNSILAPPSAALHYLNTNLALPGGGTVFLVLSSSAFCIAYFPLQVVSKWTAAGKKKD
jgi:hypothetical protein